MHKRAFTFSVLALLVALAMAALSVRPAWAQDPVETEITGPVLSIDPATFSFVIETATGPVTVFVAEDFDFSALAVGDVVEVTGTLNEDGSLTAASVTVQDPDEEPDDEGPSNGNYCQKGERQHPFGSRLAERYEVEYATLQAWFCDGFGWGQIMLALQTHKVTQDDPGALLQERRGGSGWGQIWQERHLVGKSDDAEAPNDEDGDGRPDRGNNGNGHGRPDQDDEAVGTPEPENGNGHGRPDDAGRPDDNNGHGRPDRPEKTRRPKP